MVLKKNTQKNYRITDKRKIIQTDKEHMLIVNKNEMHEKKVLLFTALGH